MQEHREKIDSRSRKRRILIADDELINREILGAILQDTYETIFACDGIEALEAIRANRDSLSMVLLDILMPGMTGLEVLKAAKADPETQSIPIIVVTSEKKSEIESLHLGAIDFIPKPYPDAGVIHARIQRTIELSEDRDIISSTERDSLTGLYNREYFYRYAEQYDKFHKDEDVDAILVDIIHFHMINERYGKAFGDEVLQHISGVMRGLVQESGGLVGRREADTFMIYCPHVVDHKALLDSISAGLSDEVSSSFRVRLRMGVYSCTDRTMDVERRFDRAKMAADLVRGSITKTIGYYDSDLHEQEVYAERLIEDFSDAVEHKQFRVFYQPKFDVRPDTPILVGAEALVRWIHPELGMISPGAFIPLFEENGLILRLDSYVWEEAARQIRAWKDDYGCTVPVSVNMSRIDMFDPGIIDTLVRILEKYDLASADLHLEVTESAYAQDSAQIIGVVEQFRDMGFQIEMDDFGTGYSSLNMISVLPIDALKLDMQFVRNAFKEDGNTHLLEIIIDIADFLSVPVIAEGVETETQMDVLRTMGCDMIQGYFFSKPVPPEEFEAFILQKKESDKARLEKATAKSLAYEKKKRTANALELTAEEGTKDETAFPDVMPTPKQTGLHLRTANIFFVVLAFAAAVALFIADIAVIHGYRQMELASDRYIAAQFSASDMEAGSDYLTDRVRCFVVTGEIEYLQDFFEEVNTVRRRDMAVLNLEQLLDERTDSTGALIRLNMALQLSNNLLETEYQAMRLTMEAGSYNMSDIPTEIADIALSTEDLALSPEEQLKKAQTLVFDNNYMHAKDKIRENVSLCTQALLRSSSQELETSSAQMSVLIRIQNALTVFFLMIVLGIVMVINLQIRRPLSKMVDLMRKQEAITPTGAEELRFVTRTYNMILQENKEARERLSHEASHDTLTGLFNRAAYDMLMESVDREHMALIIVDVDYFKTINDNYGHAVGDRVLQKVAEVLQKSFRSVDILCRIGGDEFVVVMTRSNSTMRQLVLNKINRANDILRHPKDGLPPVSLSVGVAFSDRSNPKGDIFTDADEALYRVKEAGRCGCAFYE